MKDDRLENQFRRILEFQRDFQEATKPFIDILCDIEEQTRLQLVIKYTGEIETRRLYTADQQSLRDAVVQQINQLRDELAREHNLVLPPSDFEKL